MEQEITEDELDRQLGTTAVGQFTRFRVLHIDNGIDIAGTNATGDFVEKKFDEETIKVERLSFADVFTGVILASKAQVVDKAKFPSWRTSDFDPMMVGDLIDIFPLDNGKVIKNANGEVKKYQMTYRQLKSEKSTPQPGGGSVSTYNYLIILYVGVGEEIVKLKFKGTSRGNYFDYSKLVSRGKFKIYDVNTIFSTYKDTDTGKYAIKFDVEVDDHGVPTPVAPLEVKEQRLEVAKSFQAFKSNRLEAPVQSAQLQSPPPPSDADYAPGDEDNDPVF